VQQPQTLPTPLSAALSTTLSSKIGKNYKIVDIRIKYTDTPNKYEFVGNIVYS
jgi:hypothetical protein